MLVLITSFLLANAFATTSDFFETECERYLIAADVDALKNLTRSELSDFELTTRARIFMYGHPLDTVFLRLIVHEFESRAMVGHE